MTPRVTSRGWNGLERAVRVTSPTVRAGGGASGRARVRALYLTRGGAGGPGAPFIVTGARAVEYWGAVDYCLC